MTSHNPNAKKLIMYFQVHQPLRLRQFNFFDLGTQAPYFSEELNRQIVERVAAECYLHTNTMLLRLLAMHKNLHLTFSISGVLIDQLEAHAPEVLDSFRFLALTGQVEFLVETNHHSLACMIPGDEFEKQVDIHRKKIATLFECEPTVFRNTELIYNDEIGARVHKLGFKGVMIEGAERVLGSRSPHHLYRHPKQEDLILFPRNYRLSDDIAFRYIQQNNHLSADQYLQWLQAMPSTEQAVTVAMDYETFGEHFKRTDGILVFLEELLIKIAGQSEIEMTTPSKLMTFASAAGTLSVPEYCSWADHERDLSAWLGNEMQRDAFENLIKLEPLVRKVNDARTTEIWRMLQTSDHFYYMSTKGDSDGGVHAYFSPYPSPYEAFINYMNVISDFSQQLHKAALIRDAKTTQGFELVKSQQRGPVPAWAEHYAASYRHGHLN